VQINKQNQNLQQSKALSLSLVRVKVKRNLFYDIGISNSFFDVKQKIFYWNLPKNFQLVKVETKTFVIWQNTIRWTTQVGFCLMCKLVKKTKILQQSKTL
jgi:hypothetical protein